MSEFLKMGCRQLRPSILMRSCTIALGVYWGLRNYGPGDTTGAGVLLSGQWRNVSLTHWLLITNHWYFSLIIFLERSYFLYHFASYPFTLMCNKKIFKSKHFNPPKILLKVLQSYSTDFFSPPCKSWTSVDDFWIND